MRKQTYLGLDVDGERGNVALDVDGGRQRPRHMKEGLLIHGHVGWFGMPVIEQVEG